jgi:branched-chain amino acid transport system ATP-binding protein
MEKIILEVKTLNKYFGGLRAVNDISFTVPEGVIKSIIGPNGAGKTTLFNLISGDYLPNSGQVFFMNKLITGYKPYKIARMGISRTFQTTQLFEHMTVLENVMVGRHTKTRAGFFSCIFNLPHTWQEEKKISQHALEILDTLGICDLKDEEAANLSFGQKRRVEFARALATEPQLLLLDEPAAGLNIYETKDISELILKIKERGITILLVEHDISMVMEISDQIFVINQGQKLVEGLPHEVQRDREVIRVYLGEDDA